MTLSHIITNSLPLRCLLCGDVTNSRSSVCGFAQSLLDPAKILSGIVVRNLLLRRLLLNDLRSRRMFLRRSLRIGRFVVTRVVHSHDSVAVWEVAVGEELVELTL